MTDASKKDWATPPHYVEAVRRALGGSIGLDPCSNNFSVVDAETEYQLPTTDGLKASWNYRTIFVNPPYGADRERGTKIRDWLRRCAEAHKEHRSEVIALVPVATNTSHWKLYVWRNAAAVAFLYDTRLKFLVDGKAGGKGAPMSCAMVYWGSNTGRFLQVFGEYGAAVDLSSVVAPEHKTKARRRRRSEASHLQEIMVFPPTGAENYTSAR
jgi:hypothetical protein